MFSYPCFPAHPGRTSVVPCPTVLPTAPPWKQDEQPDLVEMSLLTAGGLN